MDQKLNNFISSQMTRTAQSFSLIQNLMRFRNITPWRYGMTYLMIFIFSTITSFSQESEGPKPTRITDYKGDSSYANYSDLRIKVAKAQINLLKNGALLVRLKTNSNTINKLKEAGNIDLATQVERETYLTNKIIIASYLQEFTFCPVYFFYSNYSDSVKNKKLAGIFVDTNLVVNPAIVCNATFYLIAESDKVYNSSLGFVTESNANKAVQRGTPIRDAPIVIKNRYFIQLHSPFPYFILKPTYSSPIMPTPKGVFINLTELHSQIKKEMDNSKEAKQLIKLKNCVRALNTDLEISYQKNKGYVIPNQFAEYVY